MHNTRNSIEPSSKNLQKLDYDLWHHATLVSYFKALRSHQTELPISFVKLRDTVFSVDAEGFTELIDILDKIPVRLKRTLTDQIRFNLFELDDETFRLSFTSTFGYYLQTLLTLSSEDEIQQNVETLLSIRSQIDQLSDKLSTSDKHSRLYGGFSTAISDIPNDERMHFTESATEQAEADDAQATTEQAEADDAQATTEQDETDDASTTTEQAETDDVQTTAEQAEADDTQATAEQAEADDAQATTEQDEADNAPTVTEQAEADDAQITTEQSEADNAPTSTEQPEADATQTAVEQAEAGNAQTATEQAEADATQTAAEQAEADNAQTATYPVTEQPAADDVDNDPEFKSLYDNDSDDTNASTGSNTVETTGSNTNQVLNAIENNHDGDTIDDSPVNFNESIAQVGSILKNAFDSSTSKAAAPRNPLDEFYQQQDRTLAATLDALNS